VIIGAHAIIFSGDAEADRAFFKDVLALASVDAGGGWLIFALPPGELAVHPAETGSTAQEIYLLCEDVDETVRELEGHGVTVQGPIHELDWGRLVFIRLPGGGKLGIYEPRHPRPDDAQAAPDHASS
jgi:uncharacterized glyoxalase superfamily protein PhnB